MKKLLLFVLVLALAGGISFAQSARELAKERDALAKYSKAELNQKASKAARKESKRMMKEGWTTTPGALPLENRWISRT